jgi:hypothetical protein
MITENSLVRFVEIKVVQKPRCRKGFSIYGVFLGTDGRGFGLLSDCHLKTEKFDTKLNTYTVICC